LLDAIQVTTYAKVSKKYPQQQTTTVLHWGDQANERV
jgi:hypothetical protein